MKIIKYLLYFLVALVLLGIVLGILGPKTYKVERSVVIGAPPEMIWPHMNTLRKVNEWSPFLKMDSTAVVEYSGKDGEVGSSSTWNSKRLGKGEQTISAVDPMKSSMVRLKFFMPWGVSESDGYLNLAPDIKGTKVTWGMKGENNFMGKIMGSVMSMDKNVGPAFESGLSDLKALVDASPKETKMNFDINPGEYPGAKYLAVHKKLAMSDISSFFDKNIPALMAEIKKSKIEMTGVPVGIYYTWDQDKKESDMAAGVGIKSNAKAPAGMEIINIPSSKSLSVKYQGGYSKMGDAHIAINDYIRNNKLEFVAPVIEEYYSGPGTEPDSNKWMTTIIYLVK